MDIFNDYVLHLACKIPTSALIIGSILNENPGAVRVKVKKEDAYLFCDDSFQKKKRTSVNSDTITKAYPLHIALAHGASMDVVKLLVEKAPEVLTEKNGNGMCPLSVAISFRAKPHVIKYLLRQKKRCITFHDHKMNLPLHLACIYGCSIDVIKLLCRVYPKAIEQENFDGRTALDIAVRSFMSNDQVVDFLQEITYGQCSSVCS